MANSGRYLRFMCSLRVLGVGDIALDGCYGSPEFKSRGRKCASSSDCNIGQKFFCVLFE